MSQTNPVYLEVSPIRGAQTFQKSKGHLKVLGVRLARRSNFHIENHQTLDTTAKHSVVMANGAWNLGTPCLQDQISNICVTVYRHFTSCNIINYSSKTRKPCRLQKPLNNVTWQQTSKEHTCHVTNNKYTFNIPSISKFGVRIPLCIKRFFLLHTFQTSLEANPDFCTVDIVTLFQRSSSRGVALNTHPHLAPWLKKKKVAL